jgi:hypothetical protein
MTGNQVARPIVPVVLRNSMNETSVQALLDTGADINVLPFSIGVQLGAEWDAQRIVTGLSGNLAGYEARGLILTATVTPFRPVRLAFAWTRMDAIPIIWGQVNFFSEFDVCFFGARRVFQIRSKSI